MACVDGPGAVGVDPHDGHQGADRIDPGDVVVEGLARLGDLHLGGTCAREAGQYFGYLGGVDRRDRGVDVDAHPPRRRRRPVGRVESGGQPMRRLGVAVFQEGAEFAPAGRAVDQRQLPGGDAAEADPHRQGHDVHPVEDVVEGRGHNA